jgi:hypothetical protein
MQAATIGFRAKLAKAIAIALQGDESSPRFLARWEVTLYDSQVAATGQPHHHVMHLPWKEAQSAVRPLEGKVEAIAIKTLSGLLSEIASRDFEVSAVGIVGSPDRKLDQIGSPHIRAHAAEGILFRRVLEAAAAKHKLRWRSFSDRGFEELVIPRLSQIPDETKNTIAAIGRAAGRPWRADERAAAIAAWLMMRPA